MRGAFNMPKDLMKMKRDRDAVVTEMRGIIDAADARDNKALTTEENTRYNELCGQIDKMDADIKREEQLQDLEARRTESTDDPGDIRSFGEFLQEVRYHPNSNSLQQRELAGREGRSMTAGDGPSAGYLIPDQFREGIEEVTPQGAIFRPRADIIPAGSPPDAPITLIAFDQSGSKGVYGGVVVHWTGETAPKQDAGNLKYRPIKLEPQEVSAYVDISDKLLRNAPAVGAHVARLLPMAKTGAEEYAFYQGDGVAKPLGILGHPASIPVSRATANDITYADVVTMYSVTMGDSLVWISSRTTLPKLMTMVATGTTSLTWQPSAREGEPSTLLGIPLLTTSRVPVLGNEGDLALVDLSYYSIKDGATLALFMDPYTQKASGITRIYFFWNVDGQPRLNTSILQEDGQTQVSPFVVLK